MEKFLFYQKPCNCHESNSHTKMSPSFTFFNKGSVLQDPDRRVCFVFEKPRAGYRLIRKDFSSEPPSELEISMESRLFHGKSKELFEYLKNRSDSLRDQAPEAIKDSIWLYKSSNRIQLNEPIRNITSAYLNTFKSKIQKGFPIFWILYQIYMI